jgi:hypothetical protein
MAHLVDSKVFSFRGRSLFYLLPVVLCLLTGVEIRAQEEMPDNIAPPAVKVISKEEKSALAGTTDIKGRTKLAIDLMETRLKKAEELKGTTDYPAVLSELGTFQALMDDTLKFLNRNDTRAGKVMDTYKRFEMALRAFTPRLETIRREVPERFEWHVKRLLITVRDTRTKAVEPLFSSTVVPAGGN